jgi:hypothetical protein
MTYIRALTTDPWIEHAKQIIFAEDGVNVSMEAKNKDLLKFGRNENVGTTKATIAVQPSGILHENYLTSNLINRIVSTNAGDTQQVTIEGHTISGGDFTFVVQTVTLTGQSAVALSTPLARVTRAYNISATNLAGVVSVTETDTYTAGVPNTPALVHLQIPAGSQNSFKCAATLSSTDYWLVTGFYVDVLEKTAASAEGILEIRKPGQVFRAVATKSASNSHSGEHLFNPYLIVRPNSDIRLCAVASGAGIDVSGGIEGALLTA